jgi:alkanesulfonate monooxygenase SsuD/methylene tetrahydromethanopterin reductase-like flavin-dependent oxidoreductase (luciferase family)
MALPFRFGLGLPTNGPFAEPSNLVAFAEAAERYGIDDVWTNDFMNFDAARVGRSTAGTIEAADGRPPDYYEGLTTVAFIAGRVQRIGVGMHGIQMPMRDPRLFARQVATVHQLSGQRLTIAPAIGGPEKDFDIMQVPYHERGKITDEHLAVLHTIFHSEHPVSYEGSYVRFHDATLYPRPTGLRLWITGESEAAWRRVAKWGSGWLTSYPPLQQYAEKLARLHEIALAAGRDPAAIDTAATVFVCVEATHDQAVRVADRSLVDRFGSLASGLQKAIIGDVADVQEQLALRHQAGLRYLELKFLAHDPHSFVEMLARTCEEVLPPIRKLD